MIEVTAKSVTMSAIGRTGDNIIESSSYTTNETPSSADKGTKPDFNEQTNYVPTKVIITVDS